MGDNDSKYPTWKWLLLLAIAFVSFLGVRGIDSTLARISATEEKAVTIQKENAQACTRITILEENFKAIREDSREIKEGLVKVVEALNVHEKNTIAAIRKSRGER